MIQKLELKHVAPYLPYDLECKVMGEFMEDTEFDDNPIPKIFILIGLMKHSRASLSYKRIKDVFDLCDVFPLLRPLSDLTKEIEVNGEKFVPMEVLKRDYIGECMHTNLATWSHRVVCKLHEWHFDTFGLIDSGLAIDINTL